MLMRKFTSLLMLLVFAVTATVQAQNSTDEQLLTIVDITPAVGEVESLSEIIITFSEDVAPNGKILYLEKTTEFSFNFVYFNYVDDPELPANQLKYVTTTPVTEPCTCLLNGFDINVKYGDSKTKNFSGINYTWVVSEAATGIENVAEDAENKVVYDILGRRVENITKSGIYIVNGKKVLVK